MILRNPDGGLVDANSFAYNLMRVRMNSHLHPLDSYSLRLEMCAGIVAPSHLACACQRAVEIEGRLEFQRLQAVLVSRAEMFERVQHRIAGSSPPPALGTQIGKTHIST